MPDTIEVKVGVLEERVRLLDNRNRDEHKIMFTKLDNILDSINSGVEDTNKNTTFRKDHEEYHKSLTKRGMFAVGTLVTFLSIGVNVLLGWIKQP